MSINRGMEEEDFVPKYEGILFGHKKNEIMLFAATWMDLEIITLSEVSPTDKDIYHISYMWSLKKRYKRTYL